MRFQFKYKLAASDIFRSRMAFIYKKPASYIFHGLFTFIFLVIMILKWKEADNFFRIIGALGILTFTVVQPLAVYISSVMESKKSLDISLSFIGDEIVAAADDKTQTITWSNIVNLYMRKNLIILYTGPVNGYIITKRICGKDYEDFRSFATQMYEKSRAVKE